MSPFSKSMPPGSIVICGTVVRLVNGMYGVVIGTTSDPGRKRYACVIDGQEDLLGETLVAELNPACSRCCLRSWWWEFDPIDVEGLRPLSPKCTQCIPPPQEMWDRAVKEAADAPDDPIFTDQQRELLRQRTDAALMTGNLQRILARRLLTARISQGKAMGGSLGPLSQSQ